MSQLSVKSLLCQTSWSFSFKKECQSVSEVLWTHSNTPKLCLCKWKCGPIAHLFSVAFQLFSVQVIELKEKAAGMTILLLVPYLSLWSVSFSCCVEEHSCFLGVVSCRRSHVLSEFSLVLQLLPGSSMDQLGRSCFLSARTHVAW